MDENFYIGEELQQKLQGFSYLPHLIFSDHKVREKALFFWEKKRFSSQLKTWQSALYRETMHKRDFPQIELRWTLEGIGFGLFARESIPAFSLLGEYTGIIRKKPWEDPRKNRYFMQYPIGFPSFRNWVIDAKERGNYCRFINHSKEANVVAKSFLYEGIVRLGIVSSEKIPIGAQILLDYGDLYWKQLRETPLSLGQ